MNARAHKAFMINFFLDEDVSPLVAEAVRLTTEDGALKVFADAKKIKTEPDEENTIPRCQEDQFKEEFRMERSSFEILLRVVGKAIAGAEHLHPIGQMCLPEKLLYTLTLLSGNRSFREVGETFAISKSSGHEIFKWVTAAFTALLPRYVKWPDKDVACTTEHIDILPDVVGVIDECRIPLKLLVKKEEGQRHMEALALQAVCDEHSRFLDIYIDVPDLQCILLKSELFERLIDTVEPLMPPHKHLVGETMYPLLLNLMTPFTEKNRKLSPCHMRFNQAIRSWNAPAERAFAALISRFRRLESLEIATLELATTVVSATCMLHNFILECGEPIDDGVLDFETVPERPKSVVFGAHGLVNWDFTAAAERKRDNLVAGFMHA
ncbi:hypothetical protein KR215_012284 [Drosophila sulfurigaster]|nr:hypothetical protein KR215_012284 [Drosophila sulfurigaster]